MIAPPVHIVKISLVFTASITDYTLNNGTWNWAYNIGKRDEEFRIRT